MYFVRLGAAPLVSTTKLPKSEKGGMYCWTHDLVGSMACPKAAAVSAMWNPSRSTCHLLTSNQMIHSRVPFDLLEALQDAHATRKRICNKNTRQPGAGLFGLECPPAASLCSLLGESTGSTALVPALTYPQYPAFFGVHLKNQV